MKTILLRLLPVLVLTLGLNSCVVAPGPGYVGGPSGAGGGYADDDDGPAEMGYWGPNGEYSAVLIPGYYYGPVYYDGYGHRARYGHYNRHGHEVHSRGSSHTQGSYGHDNRSHTYSKGTQGHSTQSSTHTHLQGTGASSFKTAQQGAHSALGKKGPPPGKKKDDHH